MSQCFENSESKQSTSVQKTNHRKFPFHITPVDSKINTELLQYFHGERTGFVQVGPEKYFFPNKYKNEAEAYYNFEARSSDVWVASFPRSGTTWTQELVWLVANNLDFETAKNKLLAERFPFFEFPLFLHPDIKQELIQENSTDKNKIEFIEAISQPGYEMLSKIDPTSRRFIKTHFPFSLLPPSIMEKNSKVIYIARNPKDVAVSYYYLNRLFRTQGYVGDFARYWNYFEHGLNPWMPYFSHLNEASANRHRSNVLFLHYEDLVKNLPGAIDSVANFLGASMSSEGMENLLNHLNISNFRSNPSVNAHELEEIGILNKSGESGFIRKGAQGAQKEFSDCPDLEARANKWIQEEGRNVLEETFL